MNDSSDFLIEPMKEMYLFETNQLLEQLEEILLNSEKKNKISEEETNEIFRIMHTTKGSSAMMMFSGITSLSHSLEDLFQYLRESKKELDYSSICDLSLKSVDYIKGELVKIQNNEEQNTDNTELVNDIRELLKSIKGDEISSQSDTTNKKSSNQKYYISNKKEQLAKSNSQFVAKIYFEKDCEMENLRAYSIVHSLTELCSEIITRPINLLNDSTTCEQIVKNGLDLYLTTDLTEIELMKHFDEAMMVTNYNVSLVESYEDEIIDIKNALVDEKEDVALNIKINLEDFEDTEKCTMDMKHPDKNKDYPKSSASNLTAVKESNISSGISNQNIISVNTSKLDKLMDLVGEIVITESMVTGNPEIQALNLEAFSKSARQLRKLTDELQDVVMSIRMVPVANLFHKMYRLVRDMSKKLEKDVELTLSGEDTEVDKNIIDHLSDPLMHLIRNALDHGIEDTLERKEKSKPSKAVIKLDAINTGGDVIITITDDGRGLDREKILKKANANGITTKPDQEMSEREVFALILLPGFSTKEQVSEYSGRGVGMDVVKKNIDKLGGNIFIESKFGVGTTITIRIPLTLAIIDGMEISVGESLYTIPTISIRESFRANQTDIITDTNGNEMIMIRGNCYPIARIHKLFNVKTYVQDLCEGIMVMIEENNKCVVVFADRLIGEQQVVVKPLSTYLSSYRLKENGIGGCTILGDGSISLIIDVVTFMDRII